MEKDTTIVQAPLDDEAETESIMAKEADGEEVNQAVSFPASTVSSIFATNTIDIRLQIQPDDGHPDARRIRNVISVNGKTLRIGTQRIHQLNALIALLCDLDADQAMERFAQFMAKLSEHQQVAATYTTGTPATQPARSSARSAPVASVQAPFLGASPTPIKEEKPKESDQREHSRTTTAPGNRSTTPLLSRSVGPVGTQEKEASSPEKKPEQLTLF